MANGLSRSKPNGWRNETGQTSRSSSSGWETEVTPSGGVLSVSMQIGTWTWSAPNWSWTTAVYPPPADVKTGIEYGPNGNDFTGTLSGGGGTSTPPIMLDIATGKLIKPTGGASAQIL
jgi:hypothetical protein